MQFNGDADYVITKYKEFRCPCTAYTDDKCCDIAHTLFTCVDSMTPKLQASHKN